MDDGVTVITPTGDRKDCLNRCLYYLKRQTVQPQQWILGDDGEEPTAEIIKNENNELPIKIVRSTRILGYTKAVRFNYNLLQILNEIKYNYVIIMEDDDWYHPKYIEKTLERFGDYQIIGQSEALYYNIRWQKWRKLPNRNRASLCETAFRGELINKLRKCCNKKTAFIDARFWEMANKRKWRRSLYSDKKYCIGMKGLPGRPGIGIGHRPSMAFKVDPNWEKLIELIGFDDAQFYINWKKLGFHY